jgi:hypothetical protein
MAIEEAWEEPPLPCADHDHPALVSPDWPPRSELDQAVYRVAHDRYPDKIRRLHSLFVRHGYSMTQTKALVRELLKSSR